MSPGLRQNWNVYDSNVVNRAHQMRLVSVPSNWNCVDVTTLHFFLHLLPEVLGLNLDTETAYAHRFSWISSVPLVKRCTSSRHYHKACNSLLIYNPVIRHHSSAVLTASLNKQQIIRTLYWRGWGKLVALEPSRNAFEIVTCDLARKFWSKNVTVSDRSALHACRNESLLK